MKLTNLCCDGTFEFPLPAVTITAAVTATATLVRVVPLPGMKQTNNHKGRTIQCFSVFLAPLAHTGSFVFITS